MSTYKAPKRMTRRQELREDKVVTAYSQFLEFFEQNRTLVYGIIGGAILLVIMGFGYDFFKDQQESQAQVALAHAVRLYEEDNWRGALDGDDSVVGLLEVSEQYSGTKGGNLATYYAADALYNLGEHEEALNALKRFNYNGDAIGAGAHAVEAAIHEDLGNHESAAESYRKAALVFESDFASARYLASAGRNYEKVNEFAKAREMYELIQEQFPESEQAQTVDMLMARIDLLESK